jgi:two-component system LytT family response regulator
MRVLIVDDEATARQRVRLLLQLEAGVEIVGEAETGAQAVAMIRQHQPDLVCLDVQMPGMDGFGVLKQLEGEQVPMVLFISAHDEHAQRAFDVHAVDFVLKPLEADRFHAAFGRARTQQAHAIAAARLDELAATARVLSNGRAASEYHVDTDRLAPTRSDVDRLLRSGAPHAPLNRLSHLGGTFVANGTNGTHPANGSNGSHAGSDSNSISGVSIASNGQYATRILVKHDGRMFFVKTAEIDWIEADRNYVRLHVGAVAHTIRERISHLEETLDPSVFSRIHRSTIVNLNRVREMQQWFSGDYVVILEDGTRLRLSRHYREHVEKKVGV